MASFPPSGGFIPAIRESCRALRKESNIIIESSSIERLLTSPAFLATFQRVSKHHGLTFPLNFPSVVAELNFLAVLSLLNFASGYRIPLHEQTGRGAWDNIRALVFGLFLTSTTEIDLLTARGMQTVGEQTIAELMQVKVHVERPHESLHGVTIGELGGPMHQLVKLIAGTLRETGEVLLAMGYPDLGSLVLEALKKGETVGGAKGTGPDADKILEQIVRAIPGFRDMAIVNGCPIYTFKKALFLIHAIRLRFGSADKPPVPIPDTDSLPVFSDNVLPSLLVHLGVIDLKDAVSSLSQLFPDANRNVGSLLALPATETKAAEVVAQMPKQPPADGPAVSQDQAYILRAAAVDACEMIIEVAHSLPNSVFEAAGLDVKSCEWVKNITLPDLDVWIWAVAKDRPDYRRLERFALRDTVMF